MENLRALEALDQGVDDYGGIVEYLEEAFDDIDTDGDNFVTAAELGHWRSSLGQDAKTVDEDAFEDETLDMLD